MPLETTLGSSTSLIEALLVLNLAFGIWDAVATAAVKGSHFIAGQLLLALRCRVAGIEGAGAEKG